MTLRKSRRNKTASTALQNLQEYWIGVAVQWVDLKCTDAVQCVELDCTAVSAAVLQSAAALQNVNSYILHGPQNNKSKLVSKKKQWLS